MDSTILTVGGLCSNIAATPTIGIAEDFYESDSLDKFLFLTFTCKFYIFIFTLQWMYDMR